MRHCENENCQVYETSGRDLPTLLTDAANFIAENVDPAQYVMVSSQCDFQGGYIVTLYVSA